MMIVTPDSLAKNRAALTVLARGVAKGSYWCQNKPVDCEALMRNVSN
jgi:hypothetical protein